MRKVFFLLLLSLATHHHANAAAAPLATANLRCEGRQNPLGIDVPIPRLSWQITSLQRNQTQTAYEITIGERLQNCASCTTWKSGKVLSSQNTNVTCTGLSLQSFTRYYWRVRVYDKSGQPSEWSSPSWFETSMLAPQDWKAQWIGNGQPPFADDSDAYHPDPMPLFKRSFALQKKLLSARLYICGLGYYEAYINGQKAGDHRLDPGFTKYSRQVLYVTYDVTALLRKGTNVAAVMLGNGWWNPLPLQLFGRFDIRRVQQTGRPCVKAQLLLRYADGSVDTVVTDTKWRTAPGPVVKNSVYLGEQYDARKEQNLASVPGNDWQAAVIDRGPSGVLTAQRQPPVRVTITVHSVRIYPAGVDTFIADMGQNFGGVAQIHVHGPRGVTVRLRYGEDVYADGRLNYMTTVAGQIKESFHLSGGPGAPKTAWQEDDYTLKGSGEENWSPRFTFHSFRYVEITGWPGTPQPKDIDGLRMNSDVDSVGSFSCSNDMFNQLHAVVKRTFLSNIFSVQSDCPAREKLGYGGDMVATAQAFLYNFDMWGFYGKAVNDFENDQQPDGGLTEMAPYIGIADRGYGGESGPLGWQLAFSYLQKQLYDFYGDTQIIRQHYPALQKQMQFLQDKAINGLFHWDISDHEALDPKPEAFTASCFYYHHAMLAAEFAGIVGKKEDAGNYQRLAETIRESIIRKYWIPGTGRFDNATQSAQLFALYYGLAPTKDSALAVLMEEFERHSGHLSTGIFATKMLFDVLRENDLNEVAYGIANKRDFPGWGYFLQKGATTLWETWEYPDNAPSQNHPMFGSVDEWFYRSILGINSTSPGFRTIQIKPQPAGDLIWAKGSYTSIQGTIAVQWKKTAKKFTLAVEIPANTSAELYIPAAECCKVQEGGKDVPSTSGSDIQVTGYKNGYTVVKAGSGKYVFTSDL